MDLLGLLWGVGLLAGLVRAINWLRVQTRLMFMEDLEACRVAVTHQHTSAPFQVGISCRCISSAEESYFDANC